MKGVLSGPSSCLAGPPSVIRNSGNEQTWHMSSSMDYACSCVTGCMEAQQSEGFSVWSFFLSCRSFSDQGFWSFSC